MDVCGFARPGLLNFLTRAHAECANVTLAHLLQHGLSFLWKLLNGLVQAASRPFFDHQRSRLGPFVRLAAVRLELLTMNRLLHCSPEFSTNLILKHSNRRRTRTRHRGQSGGTRMLARSLRSRSSRSNSIIERQQSPQCGHPSMVKCCVLRECPQCGLLARHSNSLASGGSGPKATFPCAYSIRPCCSTLSQNACLRGCLRRRSSTKASWL